MKVIDNYSVYFAGNEASASSVGFAMSKFAVLLESVNAKLDGKATIVATNINLEGEQNGTVGVVSFQIIAESAPKSNELFAVINKELKSIAKEYKLEKTLMRKV